MRIPYIRSGDYFIQDLKLPEETRSTAAAVRDT